jgi:hypothetical protein
MTNITMSHPVGNITMSPPGSHIMMSPPVGTRVSMRATKRQTNRYDDFVQQISLRPGTYSSDGNNLYMLEYIGNTSSMRYMLTTLTNWQQKINQNWSPDTAYVQQLTCDSHHQTPWSPTHWNNNMASQQSSMMNTNMNVNMMDGNMMTNTNRNMMNANMLNNNMMTYNSGFLNNEGYSCYEESSP